MKTIFKYTLTIVIALLLCGCTQTQTDKLWSAPTYTENINQFLIHPENQSLIIIGEKYHYIFNKDSASRDILVWNGRKNLHANFYDFEVNAKNIVTGTYSLAFDSKAATVSEINWLKNNGFEINENGFYRKTLKVSGTRYLAKNDEFRNAGHLNKQYPITIKRPNSTYETIVNTAFTPITVTMDGIYMIEGTALVMVIAVPFIVVDVISDLVYNVVPE
ncbi:MAG: hypothetical protein AB7D34_04350 [Sulfurimonas sp.]